MKMPKSARVAAGGLIAIAALGGAWALAHDEGTAASQSTDDAYVHADFSTVSPKVAGLIDRVLVEDNQQVRKGQLLAVIDDRDFRVAVASAEAELRAAEANVHGIQATIARQGSVIGQSAAAIDADEAAIALGLAKRPEDSTLRLSVAEGMPSGPEMSTWYMTTPWLLIEWFLTSMLTPWYGSASGCGALVSSSI